MEAQDAAQQGIAYSDFLEGLLKAEVAGHNVRDAHATSGVSGGKWNATFAQNATLIAALLDRLLHHARIVPTAGENYRLKQQCAAGW